MNLKAACLMDGGGDLCPGQTAPKASDPNFIFGRLMTFDPARRVWNAEGDAGSPVSTWQAVYDPATDTIIRLQTRSSAQATIYDIASKTWTFKALGGNREGRTAHIGSNYVAADLKERVIYAIDIANNKLHRYKMDAQILEDLGPLPDRHYSTIAGQAKIAWDPLNEILYWHTQQPDGFFAYHPAAARWEKLSSRTDIDGVEAVAANVMVFDPLQNLLMMFGDVWSPAGSPSGESAAVPVLLPLRQPESEMRRPARARPGPGLE